MDIVLENNIGKFYILLYTLRLVVSWDIYYIFYSIK